MRSYPNEIARIITGDHYIGKEEAKLGVKEAFNASAARDLAVLGARDAKLSWLHWIFALTGT